MNGALGHELTHEEIRQLPVVRVVDYLNSRGWVEVTPAWRGIIRLFNRPESEHKLVQVRVPVNKELADYEEVLEKSLYVLSRFYELSIRATCDHIYYFADDLVSIREDTIESRAGSVSFIRAGDMYAGLKRALLSAAHLDIEPATHYARLDRAAAGEFIEACRFNQTRRGSYVMTAACPLNAVPEANQYQEETLFEPPFTRRVTTRLMEAALLLTGAAEREIIEPQRFADAIGPVVSTNICDALIQLAPTEATGHLEVSCSWARKKPVDNERETPTVAVLRSDMVPFLGAVRDYLRTAAKEETRQDFVGRINTLDGRPDKNNEVSGGVYARVTDPDNETITVRLDLNVQQYKVALEAHGTGRYVLVTGFLRRGKGGLRIEEHGGLTIVGQSRG